MIREMANEGNPTEPPADEEALLAEPTRAVYVDDDPVWRSMIASMLEGQFDSLEVFGTPEEALQRLQQEDRPNILWTDGDMSGMSGLQLAQEVKRLDSTITTVLISGGIRGLNINDEVARTAHGIDFYLPKNNINRIEVQRLATTIKAARAQTTP